MAERADKIIYLLIILFVLFLVAFGWKFHPIEEVNSPENDGYVDKADEIRLGQVPKDLFHPLLYPVMSAGLGELLDDTFAGARLASALFAGFFVLLTYLLGKSWLGREVGAFAAVGAMLNYNVIVAGIRTASDSAFSAFAVLILLLALGTDKKADYAHAFLLALAFALACFSRYNGMALAGPILIALAMTPSSPARKVGLVGVFAVCSVILLIPHFYLTKLAFGSPFYTENHKTLAFKLYGNGDWSYFDRVPFDSLTSVIIHSPARVVLSTLSETIGFFNSGLIGLGGDWLAGALFTTFFLTGLYMALTTVDRKMVLALSFIFFHVMAIAFTYETRRRYLLPILPLGYILGGRFLLSDAFGGSLCLWRKRISRGVPLIAVFLAITAGSTIRDLAGFIDRHPLQEVQTAVMLQKKYGPQIRVLSTFPFIHRHVNYWCQELDDAYGDEVRDEQKYFSKLRALLQSKRIEFIIIGRLTIGDRPRRLLTMRGIPPFLSPVVQSEDVVVYKIVQASPSKGIPP